ncbi:hypothetical protein GPALN_004159 [Globodera pallida]|nr:hypothetical protein GPALN_004159 [Globodera pallida]
MSNNGAAQNAQPEQKEEAPAAQIEQPQAEKTASPTKLKPMIAAEVDAGTGEESRDSVQSVGQESAEADEDEEAGDEEETDEEHPPQQAEEKSNGHVAKNGHQQPQEGDTAVETAELANGEAKARKRTSGGADDAEDASSQKKQRVEGEHAAEPEVTAE